MSFSRGLEKTAFIGSAVRGVGSMLARGAGAIARGAVKASGGSVNFGLNAVQGVNDAYRFDKKMLNAQKRGATVG